IKQGIFIKLPHRTTVGTLYVIREIFKLRFCIYSRFVTDTHVVVLLEGVRFLCILPNKNFPVEYGCTLVLRNVLIPLVRLTVLLHVINNGVIVDYLLVFC